MTQAALDSRTTLTGLDVPFQTDQVTPSTYNPLNFDVTWKPSLEPKSTFLTEDGSYLPVFASMHNDTRAQRAARRAQPPVVAPRPLANIAFALFTAAAVASPNPSSYYSSPLDSSPTSRFNSPALGHYHSMFQHHQTTELMCFISVVLPTGSTPRNSDEALSSVDARHWKFALDSEHSQLVDASTWELVPRNQASNVVTGKWVFKIKLNEDGSIDRYKARWVARGFSQRQDVDYTEIFAPVVRYSSIRTILSISNAYQLSLFGLDVSNAFARADVDEEIYVQQPHGYVQYDSNGKPLVCRLNKGLYGTKQAARLWNKKFRNCILAHGWKQLESDPCIFTRHTTTQWEIIGLYVDDIIHACSAPSIHTSLLDDCNASFPTTSQGPLTWILGMHVKRDFKNRILSIDQSQSILSYIENCDLTPEPGRNITTPMDEQWSYGSEPKTDDETAHVKSR